MTLAIYVEILYLTIPHIMRAKYVATVRYSLFCISVHVSDESNCVSNTLQALNAVLD